MSLKALQPAWYYSSGLFLAMTLIFCIAGWIDERTIQGVSVWTKPFKFSLSFVAYFGTLLLMARLVPDECWQTRSGRSLVGLTLVMAFGEMIYIILQAALGEASHFNETTAYHRTMYMLMGIGAVSLVGALVWYAFIIAKAVRWRLLSDPIVLAVTVGLVLTFVLGGGFGAYLSTNGSHFVGPGNSDANGLWLVGWSREVGDLRVAHFFGMHAMQAIPLFALVLPLQWSVRVRLVSVIAFALGYSILTIATFMQALNGQPFLVGL